MQETKAIIARGIASAKEIIGAHSMSLLLTALQTSTVETLDSYLSPSIMLYDISDSTIWLLRK